MMKYRCGELGIARGHRFEQIGHDHVRHIAQPRPAARNEGATTTTMQLALDPISAGTGSTTKTGLAVVTDQLTAITDPMLGRIAAGTEVGLRIAQVRWRLLPIAAMDHARQVTAKIVTAHSQQSPTMSKAEMQMRHKSRCSPSKFVVL